MKNGMRIFSAAIAAAIGFALSGAAAEYAEPIWYVTVNGLTNEIAEATFLKSEGGVESVSSFDEFSGATAGTLVKRGANVLLVEHDLSAFMGEVHVEGGVLYVHHRNGMGSFSGANVFAHKDASVVMHMQKEDTTRLPYDTEGMVKRFSLAGGGALGEGGALVFRDEKTGGNYNWHTLRGFDLNDDAVIAIDGNCPYANWRPTVTIDLKGHSLVMRGDKRMVAGTPSYLNNGFHLKDVEGNGGALIVSNLIFTMQGSSNGFNTDATSRFVLGSGTRLVANGYSYNYTGGTMVFEPGFQRLDFKRGSTSEVIDPTGSGHRWLGPVVLNTVVTNYNANTLEKHKDAFAFRGAISGPGGFTTKDDEAMRYRSDMILYLGANNTFTGGVHLKGTNELWLAAGRAVPRGGAPIELSDGAKIHLAAVDEYELPELKADGAISISGVAPALGGGFASIEKTGEGALAWNGGVGAEELVVKGGTVELTKFSAATLPPGLAVLTNYYSSTAKADYQNGIAYDTGVTVLQPAAAYNASGWSDIAGGTYVTYFYRGFIKSVAVTNEVWSFAMVMDKGGRLYIDGNLVIDQTSRNQAKTANCEISPGYHAFEFRYFNTSGNNGATSINFGETVFHYIDDEEFRVADRTNELGKYISPAPGVNGGQWISKFGLVVDRQGRRTHNYADYEKLVDTGDGSLFVTSTNRTDSLGWRPHFGKAFFAAGTGIDLGGWTDDTYEMPDLEGLPRVTGGNLRVTGVWKVPTSQIRANGKLSVDGRLVFGDGASIEIVEDAAKRVHGEAIVIAEATGGITMPTGWQPGPIEDETLKGQYELSLSPDGKQLLMKAISFGMILFVQ